MKNTPLVSIVVTTKNEERNIDTCLESIKNQSYKNIGILVVDNHSTDKTKEIAKKYTEHIYNKGPERSVQRNFGVSKANGEYVLILDADMKLSTEVVKECVEAIREEKVGGIIIPEESYGAGFWAECKSLERSYYVGNDLIEAARFFSKEVFVNIGGFDEAITGPEDWDLSQRVKEKYGIARIKSYIYHNEGKLSLLRTINKKYYYSKKLKIYKKKYNSSVYKHQTSLLGRYKLYLSKPSKLLSNPIVGLGMLFMKTCEFGAGGIGLIQSLITKHE